MVIEPITGMQRGKEIISEKEFPSFFIFSTATMIREYFTQYGYQFIGFYSDPDYVVVKDNNLEEAIMTADRDVYHVLNYRTGEVVRRQLPVTDALNCSRSKDVVTIFSPDYEIESSDRGMELIQRDTSNIVLEAEEIRFIDTDKVWVNTFGLEAIYSLSENAYYPLLKKEARVYLGSHPEEFVDVRYGMYITFQNVIRPLSISNPNLLDIISQYPYGQKRGNKFHLLNSPLKYGIFYKNGDFSQIKWYPSVEDRDSVLEELGLLTKKVLEGNHVKIKNIE